MNAPLPPTIFLLSGGIGASAEQLAYTVLAQFPGNTVRVVTMGNLRDSDQVRRALLQAQGAGGLVMYTLVDERLRRQLVEDARGLGVKTIDLMGPLIDWLTVALGQKPLQEPGRYRQTHREYFDRVTAIDFTLAHDDGKSPEDWPQAEVVLLGVSRSGKTPLSVYLAVLGWKVANIPLVPQIGVPPALYQLDRNRVIGLTIDPEQLLVYRRQRQGRLGIRESSSYTDLETIQDELREAHKVYRAGNFQVVNMTDKTVEMGADDILRKLSIVTGSSMG